MLNPNPKRYQVEPTILSIVSVTTSFDIVFCGAIALVILQADQMLFSALTTVTNPKPDPDPNPGPRP